MNNLEIDMFKNIVSALEKIVEHIGEQEKCISTWINEHEEELTKLRIASEEYENVTRIDDSNESVFRLSKIALDTELGKLKSVIDCIGER